MEVGIVAREIGQFDSGLLDHLGNIGSLVFGDDVGHFDGLLSEDHNLAVEEYEQGANQDEQGNGDGVDQHAKGAKVQRRGGGVFRIIIHGCLPRLERWSEARSGRFR